LYIAYSGLLHVCLWFSWLVKGSGSQFVWLLHAYNSTFQWKMCLNISNSLPEDPARISRQLIRQNLYFWSKSQGK